MCCKEELPYRLMSVLSGLIPDDPWSGTGHSVAVTASPDDGFSPGSVAVEHPKVM